MRFFFSILAMLISSSLHAEGFIKDINQIKQKIAVQEVDKHIVSGGKTPLAGEHLEALVPLASTISSEACAEEEKEPPLETFYEVLFVAEATTRKSSSTQVTIIPTLEHQEYATELVEFAAKSTLPERDLAQAMASKIRTKFKSDEERFNALGAFASKLNGNYNDARNPGFNNSKYNSENLPLPPGDLTLQEITLAAYDKRPFDGGVCNDISEAMALIGEQLFPDKDVLVITSGTHHGVVISDGKTNHVLNYAKEHSMKDQLVLDESLATTNMRINKMKNGHLQEIAIVDTQTGQMMESAFDTGKPLLKTNVDISSFVSHFQLAKVGKKKQHEVTAAAGVGNLATSQMYVVVAKYEFKNERWRHYAGLGGSLMDYSGPQKSKYQLHLRMGSEYGIVRYANPKLSLHLTTGLAAEGMYGFQNPEELNVPIDAGGGLEVVNKLNGVYRPNQSTMFKANLEVRHAFGPASWGVSTGVWSKGIGKGIKGTLGNLNLHLNQVVASAGIKQKINSKASAFADVKYQGSAIGQTLGILGGLNIVGPKDAQILVFTGHTTNKIPGFDSKHSLLVGDNGTLMGAGFETKSGILFTSTVSNITPSTTPVINASLSVPLEVKPKSKKKKKEKKR